MTTQTRGTDCANNSINHLGLQDRGTLLPISDERRRLFLLHDSVRFGGNITFIDCWQNWFSRRTNLSPFRWWTGTSPVTTGFDAANSVVTVCAVGSQHTLVCQFILSHTELHHTISHLACSHRVSAQKRFHHFLANVNSLTFTFAIYAVVRPSVACLSICNIRAPYSAGWNFRQCFYAIWYLGHQLTATENFTDIVTGEPFCQGRVLNTRLVAKYSCLEPIEDYISETVQYRR